MDAATLETSQICYPSYVRLIYKFSSHLSFAWKNENGFTSVYLDFIIMQLKKL